MHSKNCDMYGFWFCFHVFFFIPDPKLQQNFTHLLLLESSHAHCTLHTVRYTTVAFTIHWLPVKLSVSHSLSRPHFGIKSERERIKRVCRGCYGDSSPHVCLRGGFGNCAMLLGPFFAFIQPHSTINTTPTCLASAL